MINTYLFNRTIYGYELQIGDLFIMSNNLETILKYVPNKRNKKA